MSLLSFFSGHRLAAVTGGKTSKIYVLWEFPKRRRERDPVFHTAAKTFGTSYQFPLRILAAASANTWQPSTMSSSAVFSVK